MALHVMYSLENANAGQDIMVIFVRTLVNTGFGVKIAPMNASAKMAQLAIVLTAIVPAYLGSKVSCVNKLVTHGHMEMRVRIPVYAIKRTRCLATTSLENATVETSGSDKIAKLGAARKENLANNASRIALVKTMQSVTLLVANAFVRTSLKVKIAKKVSSLGQARHTIFEIKNFDPGF